MTACPDANRLLGYVTDRLDELSQAEVEAHLDTCATCMDLLVELVRFEAEAERSPWPRHDEELEVAESALFGKYDLEAVVGQGAMGTVYAAHDKTLDRKVALKILRPHADDGGARARLTRESRAMARLSHPNVVTVYDAGEQGDRLYIAMELFARSTLASWLREERPGWKDALALLLRAGEGLVAAHAAGLVHRDFKPENVLLGAASETPRRVVVTDFGLVAARQGEPAAETREGESAGASAAEVALTRTGVIIGTPRYMSPEQFEGGVVDARSDQFSFAVTAYEAIYRQHPFAGRTMEELRRAVLGGEVVPPPVDTPVPAAVHRSLLRALAVDPSRRHASLAALLGELAASLPAGKSTKRARLVVAGLVLALFAVGRVFVSLRSPARGAGGGGDDGHAVAPAVPSTPAADPHKVARTAVVVSPLGDRTGDARLAAVVAPGARHRPRLLAQLRCVHRRHRAGARRRDRRQRGCRCRRRRAPAASARRRRPRTGGTSSTSVARSPAQPTASSRSRSSRAIWAPPRRARRPRRARGASRCPRTGRTWRRRSLHWSRACGPLSAIPRPSTRARGSRRPSRRSQRGATGAIASPAATGKEPSPLTRRRWPPTLASPSRARISGSPSRATRGASRRPRRSTTSSPTPTRCATGSGCTPSVSITGCRPGKRRRATRSSSTSRCGPATCGCRRG